MPDTTRCERHGVAGVEVGPCTRESMRRLEALATDDADLAHHRERWAWQNQGNLGLAVGPDNTGARRLYRRLGNVETHLRAVMDGWDERDEVCRVVQTHTDACLYLMKPLLD